MKYDPPFVLGGNPNPSAPYVDRNTPGAISGSVPPASAIEHPQREIGHVIDFFLGSGAEFSAQDPNDLQQLRKAMQAAANGRVATAIPGQVYLTYGAPNLVLLPEMSGQLLIAGAYREVPALGATLAPTGNAAGTLYYIYAYWTGTAVALEKSAAVPVADATTRQMLKTGDATRSYVGLAYCMDAGTWSAAPLVASHYSKKPRVAKAVNPNGASISSFSNYLGLTPNVFFVVDDGYFQALGQGSVALTTQTANNSEPGRIAIGLDGGGVPAGQASRVHSAVMVGAAFYGADGALSRGMHQAAIIGKAPAAGNALFYDNLEIVITTNG